MKRFRIVASALLVTAFSFGFAGAANAQAVNAPMTNLRGDCASNHNLMHVHRRLDGVIDRLQHDQRDYGGHRERAIDDLQKARAQIIAGEQSAVNGSPHDSRRCFHAGGPTGGSDRQWGLRNGRGSDENIRVATRWVENLIDQLQRDDRDYGGHREGAIDDMQAARRELAAALQYDNSHGH